jgi:D-amino peptidase
MKILIMTDMEGVAGILTNEDWVYPTGRYYEDGKRLLTDEVNAAIEGLCQGGATELLVVDGHGPGGINPMLLDPRAELMRGHADPVWPWGLDRSFNAFAVVGQHAKAGTPYSHLTHTQGYGYLDMSVNGISIGEYGQLALCAMELGVPTILACGEKAFTEEAAALTPGVVTVAVKRGLLPDGLDHLSAEEYKSAKLSAVHLAPARACEMIRQAAAEAIRRLKVDRQSFHYPKLDPPYVRVTRFRRSGDHDAWTAREEHPTSIIGLTNMPYQIEG